jgi:phosphoglycerate kinase
MPKLSLSDVPLDGRRVFMRVDFNVPLRDGVITDDTRIEASLPSIKHVLSAGGKLILASHLGRPKGKPEEKYSLRPVAEKLAGMGLPIQFAGDCVGPAAEQAVGNLKGGQCVLLENLRFHAEEEKNDPGFSKALASHCDLYVNDAFGAAHRAHASTEGITKFVQPAVAGFLMERELKALSRALQGAERPYVAVVGGAKVSDKIELIENFLSLCDHVLIGGAMAYTFLRARKIATGKSLVEADKIELAGELLARAARQKVSLELPVDHVVAAGLEATDTQTVAIEKTPVDKMGLDIGPETIKRYGNLLRSARTIVWNGPMGVFENPLFARGTFAIAQAVSESQAFSIVGGGDSVAAVAQSGVEDKISHISTGGGASLEFLSGQKLPGVEALTEKKG